MAFSCKGRGFCPSCGGRRMAERAAHLVDHVLPDVPVRQWVLTVPHRLRYLLAWRHDLCRVWRGILHRAIERHLRARARHHGVTSPRGGGVAVIQRFGGSLISTCTCTRWCSMGCSRGPRPVPSGFTRRRRRQPPTSPNPGGHRAGVRRLLRRHGLEADDGTAADPFADADPLLAGWAAASVQGLAASGASPHRPRHSVERHGDVGAGTARLPRALGGLRFHAGVRCPLGIATASSASAATRCVRRWPMTACTSRPAATWRSNSARRGTMARPISSSPRLRVPRAPGGAGAPPAGQPRAVPRRARAARGVAAEVVPHPPVVRSKRRQTRCTRANGVRAQPGLALGRPDAPRVRNRRAGCPGCGGRLAARRRARGVGGHGPHPPPSRSAAEVPPRRRPGRRPMWTTGPLQRLGTPSNRCPPGRPSHVWQLTVVWWGCGGAGATGSGIKAGVRNGRQPALSQGGQEDTNQQRGEGGQGDRTSHNGPLVNQSASNAG